LRIISGIYKGRQIHPPKNFRARPTTDFARESLFNVLGNHFDFTEIKALDLFSGTGSIGFEFSSRGAIMVEMVEKNFIHAEFIKKTIQAFGVENVRAIKSDAIHYIEKIKLSFDIIFADPPYDMKGIETIPDAIFKKDILLPGGWFILEHSSEHSFSQHPYYIQLKKYGSVHFSFFEQAKPTK
jgi:16S rRNA (guanine(966)-N(2))-methyltransferase RsmD